MSQPWLGSVSPLAQTLRWPAMCRTERSWLQRGPQASHPVGELVPWSTQVKATTPAASLGNACRGNGHITVWKLRPLVPSLPVSYLDLCPTLPRLFLLLPPMVSRTPGVTWPDRGPPSMNHAPSSTGPKEKLGSFQQVITLPTHIRHANPRLP